MQGKVGAVLAPLGFGLLAIALLGAGGANAVTDVAPPSLTLPAATTTNATSSRGAFVSFIAVATDDVQPTSLICAPASGSRFVVGSTMVTCTATDAASHSTSSTFTITVQSATEQLALLRSAVTALHIDPSVEQGLLDKLDSAKRSIQASQSKVACNQLDAFANQVRAQTHKAIADGTSLLRNQNEIEAALDCVKSIAPPVLLGPRADVTTTTAPGLPTATVRFTGSSSSGSCAPTSPATLAVGANTVQCTATDANGTTRTSFVVTVVDQEPPVLKLPADATVTAPAGSSTAPVDFSVSASDNVAVGSIVCNPPSGTRFAYGATTVTCIATDTSRNTATGTFKVTVNFAITGRITDRDTTLPLADVRAAAFDTVTGNRVNFTASGSDGRYSVVVPPGTYTVLFNGNEAVSYLPQRWNGKRVDQPGDPVTLGRSVGGIDAALVPGYFVHGQVTDASTHQLIGPPGVVVDAVDPALQCCRTISESATAPDGTYRLIVPKGSPVKLQFRADPSLRYVERWWNGRRNFNEADTLTVNAETFGINVSLIPAVLISGKVTDDRDGSGIGSVAVVITDSTTPCCPFGGITVTSTASDGTYSLLVPKGIAVKIQFVPSGLADPHFMGEWFDDQPSWDAATIRSFTADTTGISAGLSRGLFISGHVARQDGTAIGGLYANANDGLAGCCHFITGSRTDASGNYHIFVRPGTYKVLFFSRPGFLADDGVTYVDQWWNGAPSFEQGTEITVSAADVDGINAVMNRAVIVSGHVTDATGQIPVAGFQVNALDALGPCCQFVGGAQTDANGDYRIAVPPGLTVRVDFGVFSGPPPGTRYLPQWWNNKTSFDAADPILATADVSNINARLANGFLITGHVSERGSGAALEGMHVQVFDPAVPCCPFREIAHTETSATGDYAVVLAAGSYKVQFSEFPQPAVRPHLTQWWQNKPFEQGADLLVVVGDRTGIDATLPLGVFISGTVTAAGGTVPVVGLNVSAQDASQPCCHFVGGAQTDASGNYRFPVPAGSSVRVEFGVFSGPPPGTRYLGQWWNNKPDFGAATTINALGDASGINADLASGFVLSGHVSDASGTTPLGGIGVNANDATMGCCRFIVGTQTDAEGNYRLIVPAGRVIRVFFSTNPAGGVRYLQQWWNGKPFFDQADDIAMTQDRPGVDAHLALGVLIHGRVTDSTGTIPVVGLNVSAQDATQGCCQFVGGSQTDLDGQYAMVVPSGHDVKIEFGVFGGTPPGTRYLGEWWNNAPSFDRATAVSTNSDQNNIDAQLDQGFVISGQVRAPGGAGVPNVFVGASLGGATPCCQGVGGTNTDPTGHYRLVLRPGVYRINVNLMPERHLVSQWWAGVPGGTAYFQRATDIVLGPADASDRDFDLQAGSVISGHVSDAVSGVPVGGFGVTANDAQIACCEGLAFGGTDPMGNYALVVPVGRHVRVFFGGGPASSYNTQWWDNKPDFGVADVIDASVDRPAIDAHLTSGFVISGHVIELGGGPLGGVNVAVIDPVFGCCPFREVGHTQTNANGDYSVRVPAGTYKIRFLQFAPPARPHMDVWWPDKTNDRDATPIVVLGDRPGIDAALPRAVSIRGHVSDATTAAPISGSFVAAWDATVPCCRNFTADITDASGNYFVIAPLGGHVKVGFGPPIGSRYLPQFWDGQPSFDMATTIEATADQDGVDAQLQQGFVISGTVAGPSGPASAITVSASRGGGASCCVNVGQTTSDGTGHYQLTLPAGTYRIQAFAPPSFRVVMQWWNGTPGGTPSFDRAVDITVGPGDAGNKDFAVVFGSLIEGRVTDGATGMPLGGIGATANDAALGCCEALAFAGTDALGNYAMVVPRGRQVKVVFGGGPGSPYNAQWWDNKANFGVADSIDTNSDHSGISARLAQGFRIRGHVSDRVTFTPLANVNVEVIDPRFPCCPFHDAGGAISDANGDYLAIVPAGTYKIAFYPPPGAHYVAELFRDVPTIDLAESLTVNADVSNIDAHLQPAVFIDGLITDGHTNLPIEGILVQAMKLTPTCCEGAAGTNTDANGHYRLVVPPGTYKLFFGQGIATHAYVSEWWNNKPGFDTADPRLVNADTVVDVQLAPGLFVRGHVTDTAGNPIRGAGVSAYDASVACCLFVGGSGTDQNGDYALTLPPGSYKIQFFPPPGTPFQSQFWNGKPPQFDLADTLAVNADVGAIDAHLASGFSIHGNVSDRATHVAIAGIDVQAYDATVPCCSFLAGTKTNQYGDYTLVFPSPVTVKVTFQAIDLTAPAYVQRWWNDKADFGPADQIVVTGNVTDINELMDGGYKITGRVTDAANPTTGVADVFVDAQPNFSCCFYGTKTMADGRYIVVVSAATYRISFFPPSGTDFLEQWWNNKPGYSAADLLTVPSTTVDLGSLNAVLLHGIPVSGTVTAAIGAAPVGSVGVVASLDDPAVPCCVNYQALTAADGTYTMYVRAGRYRINFQPPNTTDLVQEYWNGQPDFTSATLLDVAAPTSHIDATLDRGFRISGRVTDAAGGGPVQNVVVTIGPAICCASGTLQVTGADGTYAAIVPAGTYLVGFNPPFGSDYVLQYWSGKPGPNSADPLIVDKPRPNIDAVLTHGVRLSGRITDTSDPTRPLPGASVSASRSPGFEWVAGVAADADGNYSLFVPPGDYFLYFSPPYPSDYLGEYWNDKVDQAAADVLHVTGAITGLNAGLARGLRISGRVIDESGNPIPGIFVTVDKPDLPFTYVASSTTDGDGRYSVSVRPGSYKVNFAAGEGVALLAEWWNDKENFSAADPIDVTGSVGGIDATLGRAILISGHITSTAGAPLRGAIAYIAHGDEACCSFYEGRLTQANGAYSFTVAPGNYFVGFYADGYTFQYWNGKTDPSAASLLSGAADHLNIDAALAPIDASPPAGSGPPSDGTGSSASPIDGTAPAGSGAPTDPTTGAGAALADDRAIALGLISPPLDATWSHLSTA